MTVATALRKTLALAVSAALLLPTHSFAGLARTAPGGTGAVIRSVPIATVAPASLSGGLGIIPLSAVVTAPTIGAPASIQPAQTSPALQAIERLQAAGVPVGTSGVSPIEAQQLIAAAAQLPEGSAKQNIVAMARMMASIPAGTSASASPADGGAGRVFDNGAAQTAQAAPVAGNFISRWWSGLSRAAKAPQQQPAPKAIDPAKREVPYEKTRWSPTNDPRISLPASTRDISPETDPAKPIVGQDNALKSIYYGLTATARHTNVFISGPEGSGRETAAKALAAGVAKGMATPNDLVQVTNFMDKENPLLLELPAGQAPVFAEAVSTFIEKYKANILGALNNKMAVQLRKQIKDAVEAEADARRAALDEEIDQVRLPGGKFGIRLVIRDNDDGTVNVNWAVTYPNDGKMDTFSSDEEVNEAITTGKFTREEWEKALKDAKTVYKDLVEKYREMIGENNELKEQANDQIQQVNAQVAESLVEQIGAPVMATVGKNRHDTPAHKEFEKAAKKRLSDFHAEAAKVRVGKYGILIQFDGRSIGVALAKVVDGKLVQMSVEEMGAVIESGEVTEAQIRQAAGPLAEKLKAVLEKNNEEHVKVHENDEPVTPQEQQAMQYVQLMLTHAARNWGLFTPSESADERKPDPKEIYQANVQVSNAAGSGAPVVEVKDYSFDGIFGTADGNKKLMLMPNGAAVKVDGPAGATYKAGSLQKARGGYWIANAMDLLRSPGVWPQLMRYVRTGEIEIVEDGLLGLASLKGGRYHVPSKTKIVLIGSPMINMMLKQYDEDFALNFPDIAFAQFQPTLPINEQSIAGWLQFMAKVVSESAGEILHHTQDAMAKILEFGSKLSGSNEKLTAQFGVAYGLMRDASHMARLNNRQEVTGQDIDTALAARSLGPGVYVGLHQEAYLKGVFKIETDGEVKGQMNGLAVIGDDRGVAMRMTVDEVPREPGDPILVSLDRNAGPDVTGSSFNKALGVEETIIRKVLGWHGSLPVSFRLSFEQNYGGIDGDSATSTIVYALISAISGVPIKQQYANTGSSDQRLWVQPIGGVNAKIAGFYDIAASRGLTGKQGVLIPQTNVSELNLRPDIAEAVKAGKFHVYAVSGIEEAMEILTGVPWATIQARAQQRLMIYQLLRSAQATAIEKGPQAAAPIYARAKAIADSIGDAELAAAATR